MIDELTELEVDMLQNLGICPDCGGNILELPVVLMDIPYECPSGHRFIVNPAVCFRSKKV